MKISRGWLQTFFDHELPDAEAIARALTFHAFEIDGIETRGNDHVLDVKVTPNRGHDCLSHRGIAKELSAILAIPLKRDLLREEVLLPGEKEHVSIVIDEPELCSRYIAGYIQGVAVGPSPAWLSQRLEAIGQRSINNIVDATNYVMFELGQPLHAFDAAQLAAKDGLYAIGVRRARDGEKLVALDEKEYTLAASNLVIVDRHANAPIGIAGVKGGKPAGVMESTRDIIIESANFDGASVRKTAQELKLRTDASSRFEQELSPEYAAYGMRAAADLIVELAGGAIAGFTDVYPSPQKTRQVSVSVPKVNSALGTHLTALEMTDALTRLDLSHELNNDVITVTPPFERLDLVISEDLIEEIGRIVGYDKVAAAELPPLPNPPTVNQHFYAMEAERERLLADGYSEVYTSVFADTGERAVLNKVGGERPYLRTSLADGLIDALERNVRVKDIVGVPKVMLFEIGTVWRNGAEEIVIAQIAEKEAATERPVPETAETPAAYEAYTVSATEQYAAFSRYPFIVRDIAMWVPTETDPKSVLSLIAEAAGNLLIRSALFDTFQKGEKTSLAFRLVFQSFEKTLTDEEVNAIMERVQGAVAKTGYDVR